MPTSSQVDSAAARRRGHSHWRARPPTKRWHSTRSTRRRTLTSAGSRSTTTATWPRQRDISSTRLRWSRPTPTSSASPQDSRGALVDWIRPSHSASIHVARDPVNADGHQIWASAYRYAGRLDEAIAAYRTALSLAPDASASRTLIGEVLLQKGDAKAALGRDPAGTGGALAPWRIVDGLSRARTQGRVRCRARRTDREVREDDARTTSPACSPSGAKPTAPSNGWTRRSVPRSDSRLDCRSTRCSQNLHADPRWLPFLRRLGMAPEQLAAIKFDVKVPN